MYTIGEFRKNLRKAFSDADNGHQVVIERYGQMYQLVSLVNLPLGGSVFESSPADIKPIKKLKPKFKPKPIKIPDYHLDVKDEKTSVATRVIKSPKDAEKAVRFKPTRHITRPKLHQGIAGLCKIHGTPLDDRGKCLQKGCKYS